MSGTLHRSQERGVALLLVLWVFMILGVLALDFGRYMRDDAAAAVNSADETRGYYLAVGGMMRALWLAQQDRDQFTSTGAAATGSTSSRGRRGDTGAGEPVENPFPVDGGWHAGVLAGGRYEIRLVDQGGLVSLNKASDVLLTKLISGLLLGANYAVQGQNKRSADAIATIVDRIIDYRDPDRLKRIHGLESASGYVAKNGWFDSPEELLRIPGITPDLVYGIGGESDGTREGLAAAAAVPGLRDVVSVYNQSDNIHIKTASLTLLAILLGKDPDGVVALKELRETDPTGFVARIQAEAQAIDPDLASRLVDEPPKIVLVEGRGDMANERGRASVAAVVELGGEDIDEPKIIRWFDRAPWDGALPAMPGSEARS